MNIFQPALSVELVENLYQKRNLVENPKFYKDNERNPYQALCDVIPQNAKYYAIVQDDDTDTMTKIIQMMKNLRRHKKIVRIIVSSNDIDYNKYLRHSIVSVIYV